MTEGICEHLERRLPNPDRGKHRKKSVVGYSTHIARSPGAFSDKALRLEQVLYDRGLREHEVSPLMDYYVSKISLREIALKQGYINHQTVARFIERTVERIKNMPEVVEYLRRAVQEE